MLLQFSHFFPFAPFCLVPPFSSAISPPWFMSVGHACKFFGFSLTYTILNLPLSILFLQIMLLDPCTISLFPVFQSQTDIPPNDPHTYDSVLILVVCLVCICFCFLDSVVDS